MPYTTLQAWRLFADSLKGVIVYEQILIYLIPYMVSVSISAGVGFLALRRRDVAGAGAFGFVALSQSVWTFGYLLELASGPLDAKIFWNDVQFIAGVGWFILTGLHNKQLGLITQTL